MKFSVRVFFLAILSLMFINCSSDAEEIVTTQPPEENGTDPNSDPDPTAIIGLMSASGNTLDFGVLVESNSKTQILTLTNTGNTDLDITSTDIPDGYTLDWTEGIVKAGDSKDITVTFMPTAIANFNGSITFSSNATSGTESIEISGMGVAEIFEGNVELLNQQEVIEFGNIGYTEITGDLTIGNDGGTATDITSLLILRGLTQVKNLYISNNPSLLNLDGLQDISATHILRIAENQLLENLEELSSITMLAERLIISGNDALTSVNGLVNLTSIGGLLISNNNSLGNIDGLIGLTSIGDSGLDIFNNPVIEDVDGLANLTTLSGNFKISRNRKLYRFCALRPLFQNNGLNGIFFTMVYNRYNIGAEQILNGTCERNFPDHVYGGDIAISRDEEIEFFVAQGFTEIEGHLQLWDGNRPPESQISSLAMLNVLTKISGELRIWSIQLSDLSGLENIVSSGLIKIEGNELLNDFCTIVPLIQSGGANNGVSTSGNAYNPTTQNLVAGDCSI